ncbi:class II glutamine amidotransferase [Moorena producens]|uniref:class II glutamine amidotransferase n=1 Tax=Moorena producens TaxID=1155739 RepID=UPI003C784991
MCRVLGYIGEPLAISKLILEPDNSLVNQSYDSDYHHMVQLAGFGLATWKKDTLTANYPFLYKGTKPPFYDRNLKSLCESHETNLLLSHIRAAYYTYEAVVHEHNCHPFIFPGFRLALAHNGWIYGFKEIRFPLLNKCRPEIIQNLEGSTDTEVIYALIMSQVDDPTKDLSVDEIIDAINKTVKIILDVKTEYNCEGISVLKLFLADSNDLLVANLGIGYNRQLDVPGDWQKLTNEELQELKNDSEKDAFYLLKSPVWSLKGKNFGDYDGFKMQSAADEDVRSVIISSEPLTEDVTGWSQVPFQHICFFDNNNGNPRVQTKPFPFN